MLHLDINIFIVANRYGRAVIPVKVEIASSDSIRVFKNEYVVFDNIFEPVQDQTEYHGSINLMPRFRGFFGRSRIIGH